MSDKQIMPPGGYEEYACRTGKLCWTRKGECYCQYEVWPSWSERFDRSHNGPDYDPDIMAALRKRAEQAWGKERGE